MYLIKLWGILDVYDVRAIYGLGDMGLTSLLPLIHRSDIVISEVLI